LSRKEGEYKMAHRKDFTVVIGLSIVVGVMLLGAVLSALIPPRTPIAETGGAIAQVENAGSAESFGPLIVYALSEPQASRPPRG
jgi:hypothetical protein